MKAAKIAAVLIGTFMLVRWIHMDEDFTLPTILPFLGGHKPDLWYDAVGGLGMLAIAMWGLRRLSRRHDDYS